MLKTLEERGADLSEILQEMAVKLALEDNRFQGENGIYSEENRIVGDGTVLTAASSKTQNESVDLETGEIRKRRMDLVSQQHTEGGGGMTPCSESGLFESLSSPVVGGKARLLWQVGNIIRRKTSFGFCNASMSSLVTVQLLNLPAGEWA